MSHLPLNFRSTCVKIPVLGFLGAPSGLKSPLILHLTWVSAKSGFRSLTDVLVIVNLLCLNDVAW
jgi:hypothetical protein